MAVDRRVGVIQSMLYSTGTSSDVFMFFAEFFLLPALVGTGPRIIMMDRLASHFGAAELLMKEAGHTVIARPSYSCDFALVEWVFHFVDTFCNILITE
jgi:transposase